MKANINIHNYEEYFLLYADGELSVEEMSAVESFLSEHPELQPALGALLESRLSVDDKIIFEAKDVLFKTVDKSISSDNYEEYFLLYVDDELSNEQKTETEKFVMQHPALQNEFTLLKQTRLPKETTVFAEKQSLYRKERTAKPIVFITWKRFAVAASVAGLIFATWFLYPKKLAVTESSATMANVQPQTKNQQEIKEPGQIPSETKTNKIVVNKQTLHNDLVTTDKVEKNNYTQNIAQTVNTVNKDDNAIADNTDFSVQDKPRVSAGEIAVAQTEKVVPPAQLIQQLPDSRRVVNTGIKTVVRETKNATEENDNTMYVANVQINKNKIPNILKRARSILHFNGSDDNSIAIANFTISK